MEGKAVLFKKFAGIDCFDLELDERDPQKLIDIIAALEPTFGAINLEDIKAPECFTIERALRKRMKIPVFHDDQHGTAITVGAAVFNGLKVVGKKIEKTKLVASGAGAAALACLELLVNMGLPRENIVVTDIKGVVYKGRREEMDPDKERFAIETRARTLDEVIAGADIFLGLSAGGVLKASMVKKMAERPLILALANPNPEISPGRSESGAARLRGGHRALGLSEPGEQRPLLPVHLPRRARRGRDHHQQRNGARRGARHRRARPGRDLGAGGARLRHRVDQLRPGVHHPEAVRPAPDRARRARGGAGGDGIRRRHAPARRHRRLPAVPQPLRLSLRRPDAAAVHGGEEGAAAHRLRRGRGRARAARGADRGRRGPGAPGAGRAPAGHRAAPRAPRPARAPGQGLRAGESRSPTRAIAITG